MPTIPISGEPLWGDTAFVDPGATTAGGGTSGGTGGSGGGGGTGGGSHRYWQLNVNSADQGIGVQSVEISEWALYDGSGAAISTATAIATGSPSSFGAIANIIDGNPTTFYTANGFSFPQFVQLQFASPVAVDHFDLTTVNTFGNGPTNFELRSSDDGSTWTTVFSYRNAMWPLGGTIQRFFTGGIIWRLNVTACGTATDSACVIADWSLFDAGSAPVPATGGTLLASSQGIPNVVANAFDGSGCSTYWHGAISFGVPSGGSPSWIAYHFPTNVSIASFTLTSSNSGAFALQAPTAFALQWSTDGVTFTTAQTYTASWTGTCQTQSFTGGGGGGGGTASIVIDPDQGLAGSNYNVAVTGTGTHFATGVTQVTMSGDGVTITNVVVTDATDLLFNVAIAPGASLGARTVTTVTNAEAPTATFTILPAVAPPPSTQPGFVRGDIGWSQLRLGRDGRWGLGLFGCSTDGSFLPGDIPQVNADGTLIGSGQSITSILQTVLGTTTGTGVNGVPAGSGGVQGVNGGTGGTGVNTPPSANGLPAIAGSVTPPPTGVRITLTAAGVSAATITDIQGNFQINIPGIGTYTITPSLAGFVFSPISQSVEVSQTATPTLTTPFTATAIAPTAPGNTTVANQIFADMTGGNESTLHGLPASFGMAHGPTIGISRNVGSQHALVWWLDAYQDAAIASTAVATQIEIKSAQLWWLRASTGQWVKGLDPATSAAAVSGGYYAENLAGSQLSAITFTTQGDGGISFAMLSPDAGRAFAPSPRIAITPSNLGGIAVTVFARLIGSDTANAHYLLGVGADAYASTTGPGDKQTLGTGKFKKLTTTYRSFSMTTLTAQQILDNPPPISFTGVSV